MAFLNNTTQNEFIGDTSETESRVLVVIYILIGLCGLLGNILVIYVILKSPKMRTVTNMYIFNLAISDLIFLLHIAMITTTTIVKHWVFGEVLCKIFFTTLAITSFSSVLTLTSLSVDRYIAVCKPDLSQKHRQPLKAVFLIVVIWTLSLLLSMPIILFSRRTPHPFLEGKFSCYVDWDVKAVPIYVIYIFVLGFAVPLCFISTFYTCIIVHVKRAGPANRKKSKEQRKNHRKVTFLVFAIILSYVICWLPYWIFQIVLVVMSLYNIVTIVILHICTVLTFVNSMINPFLYAFISNDFRYRFKEVFKFQCTSSEQGSKASAVALDSLRRHASNPTEEVINSVRHDKPLIDNKDSEGIYTGP